MSFTNREPKVNLPERWAGQKEDVLRNEIPELNFCHAGRFLAAFDTVEGAKKGALIAIKEDRKQSAVHEKMGIYTHFKISAMKLVRQILKR
jgi:hypothetical protein